MSAIAAIAGRRHPAVHAKRKHGLEITPIWTRRGSKSRDNRAGALSLREPLR